MEVETQAEMRIAAAAAESNARIEQMLQGVLKWVHDGPKHAGA
jgi:hypothetical protein